jgi:hypothetical protein
MPNLNTNIDNSDDEDLLPEYDFTNGIRGKHYQQYQQGHSVTIHHEDGTITTENFPKQNDIIILDPDVKKYFPDSESVNNALRHLLLAIPNL